MSDPEKFASFYQKKNLEFSYWMVDRALERFIPLFRGSSCLEMGPATGYMTKRLAEHFGAVTAVEGSVSLLQQVPDFPNVTKVHSLFEAFEPEATYDTIVCNHVMEHIEQPVALLKKMRSWLSPSGIAIIGVPNAKSFHRLAAVDMGLLTSEYELNERDHALGHYRVYDQASLREDIEAAGLRICAEGGIFMKFLSNQQTVELLSPEIIEAYFKLADRFVANSAEIYFGCEADFHE